MQIFKIIQAWSLVLKGKTTSVHKQRASVCETCPSAIYKKYIDFVNDELKEVKGFICDDCGCPLVAKIRSTDKCYKWEK